MNEEQKSLDRYLSEVQDESTFLAFIYALMRDNVDSPDKWENGSIESFLECGHAWAIATNRMSDYKKHENPWQRCAAILYAGKYYE